MPLSEDDIAPEKQLFSPYETRCEKTKSNQAQKRRNETLKCMITKTLGLIGKLEVAGIFISSDTQLDTHEAETQNSTDVEDNEYHGLHHQLLFGSKAHSFETTDFSDIAANL